MAREILPIDDEFKARLKELYQNINRNYYGQDFESSTFNAKVAHYNAPDGELNTCGDCMWVHKTIPKGFIDVSCQKWAANLLASFGAISVVCPENQSWTVEYVEPFRRQNHYPIYITDGSDYIAGKRISGCYCINSYYRFDDDVAKSILGFNHVTDFDYDDICLLLYVFAVDDDEITAFENSGEEISNVGITVTLEEYWNGWYNKSAGIKNYQKYPNIIRLYASPQARFGSERHRSAKHIGIQTSWFSHDFSEWKKYMTYNKNYDVSFGLPEDYWIRMQASQSGEYIAIAGLIDGYISSFPLLDTLCKIDTTIEGTFSQLTSFRYSPQTINYVDNSFLKPYDVAIQTATFRSDSYFKCISYMRCEDFTKEKMLREAAYLGFWFTGNSESASNGILGEDWNDPLIYCPVFNELFITTGAYYAGINLQPPPVIPIKRGEYITIYDSRTPQDKFDTHGLGVLNPTVCEISETLNGSYTLSIEHPIDPYGKWQYIKIHNIIKALGQLFIIRVVEEHWSGSKGSVTANAEHIFYGLNDYLLPHGRSFSASGARNWAKDYINVALTVAKEAYFDGATNYEYSYGINDRTPVTSVFRDKWNITPEPMNISQLIIGENMLLADTNTQLYRDNFYFSLYERKENTKDNAFEIRIGLNLTGIKRTVDSSTLVTHFTGYNDSGGVFSISWTERTTLKYAPHAIRKEMKFDASSWNGFVKQVSDFWSKNCYPLASYEVDLEAAATNSDFEEFTGKADYTVGNKGIVYDKRLGERLELQITGTVIDAIRNKVKKVSFGGTRNFVGSNSYQPVIQEKPVPEVNAFQQVRDLEGNFCFDSDGNRIIQNVNVV